jgi:hypothetical protein
VVSVFTRASFGFPGETLLEPSIRRVNDGEKEQAAYHLPTQLHKDNKAAKSILTQPRRHRDRQH